ncbi:MAG: hypothetical protein GXY83_12970 [Rhodopirellula sp.]|nr:hypothetical protein [Rhodopirellula sp.]
MLSVIRLLVVCAAVLAFTSSALEADEIRSPASPFLSESCGGCWGGWSGWSPWSAYSREYIAYHALHPPVYYSFPVPRTYGYSPFAYPPGTRTPEVIPVAPVVVPNPHVPQENTLSKPTSTRITKMPLRIRNPFVVAKAGRCEAEPDGLTAIEPRRPQVVFPTAVR